MRDAITALEAALGELEHARAELPGDLAAGVDEVIAQTRGLLESLRMKAGNGPEHSR